MSEFNIEIAGGSTVRLPTAGKYCDRDIVVTGLGGGSGNVDITGTWVFNEDPDLTALPRGTDVSFSCNGTTYTSMERKYVGAPDWEIYRIYYGGSTFVYTNNPSGNYSIAHGWEDEAYKTIEILENPIGQDFSSWLQANATKTA